VRGGRRTRKNKEERRKGGRETKRRSLKIGI
jgi:hypothetical protein